MHLRRPWDDKIFKTGLLRMSFGKRFRGGTLWFYAAGKCCVEEFPSGQGLKRCGLADKAFLVAVYAAVPIRLYFRLRAVRCGACRYLHGQALFQWHGQGDKHEKRDDNANEQGSGARAFFGLCTLFFTEEASYPLFYRAPVAKYGGGLRRRDTGRGEELKKGSGYAERLGHMPYHGVIGPFFLPVY